MNLTQTGSKQSNKLNGSTHHAIPRLKVINIIEEGRYGGPHNRITKVAQALKAEGVDTLVVIPKQNSQMFREFMDKWGVQYQAMDLRVLTKGAMNFLQYLLFFIPEIIALIRLFKKEKPDVVHCNGSYQIKGIIASKLAGVPNVWHLNDTKQPRYITLFFSLIMSKMADNYITASYRTKDYYSTFANLDKGVVKVIQAPVDTDEFDSSRCEHAKELQDNKAIKITMVSNMAPNKGQLFFVQMAHHVNQHATVPVHFYIVGGCVANHQWYKEEVEQYCRDHDVNNIDFLGKRSDVKNILSASDISVCASGFEGSPIAVWEALSMGNAMVSTNAGDVGRFAQEYDCCLVVERNAEAMGKAVLRLLDEDLRNAYGQKARTFAIENIDLRICWQKHKAIYQEIKHRTAKL